MSRGHGTGFSDMLDPLEDAYLVAPAEQMGVISNVKDGKVPVFLKFVMTRYVEMSQQN